MPFGFPPFPSFFIIILQKNGFVKDGRIWLRFWADSFRRPKGAAEQPKGGGREEEHDFLKKVKKSLDKRKRPCYNELSYKEAEP
jgi:hypothetical protein